MPAVTMNPGREPGQDALDLGVCIKILKKAIVLLPLLIMVIIFLVKITLTEKPQQQEGQFAKATNTTSILVNALEEEEQKNLIS